MPAVNPFTTLTRHSSSIVLGIPGGTLGKPIRRSLGVDAQSRTLTHRRLGAIVKILRTQDLPRLLDAGLVDVALFAEEWALEHGSPHIRLGSLPGYAVSIALLSPHRETAGNLAAFLDRWRHREPGPRIVTEYPRLAEQWAAPLLPSFSVVSVWGSCEAYVPDFADAAIDCVETGRSAEANGLHVVAPIHSCRMLLAANATALSVRRQEIATLCHYLACLGCAESLDPMLEAALAKSRDAASSLPFAAV